MAKRKQRSPERAQRRFQTLLRQGTQALHQGDISTAIKLLEQSCQLNKDNPDAALNLSGAYILAKKFAQAAAILEPLSEQEADNPMVWTNLGAAYLGNPILATDERQQRAISAFKQALTLDPATPNVAYNLGLIYRDRQETAEAIRWFQRAIETNPNDKDARHYLHLLQTPQ
jgi:tetratricopeptide (TPR) repeat protein